MYRYRSLLTNFVCSGKLYTLTLSSFNIQWHSNLADFIKVVDELFSWIYPAGVDAQTQSADPFAQLNTVTLCGFSLKQCPQDITSKDAPFDQISVLSTSIQLHLDIIEPTRHPTGLFHQASVPCTITDGIITSKYLYLLYCVTLYRGMARRVSASPPAGISVVT